MGNEREQGRKAVGDVDASVRIGVAAETEGKG